MKKTILLLLSLSLFIFSCTQLKLARQAYDQQNYEQTISICKKVLASDSTDIGAMKLLANAYIATQQLDSAVTIAEMLAGQKPDNKENDTFLYGLYLAMADNVENEKPKDALAWLQKACNLLPEKPSAFERKGDIFLSLRKLEPAKAEYSHALQKGADSLTVKPKLSTIDSLSYLARDNYARGEKLLQAYRYEAAAKEFQKALEFDPLNKQARYKMHMAVGQRLYKKGSIDALWDAIDHFAHASLFFPKRAEPHYFLGLAYNKKDKNEYTNALDEFSTAMKLEPESKWGQASAKEYKKILDRKKKMEAFWGK